MNKLATLLRSSLFIVGALVCAPAPAMADTIGLIDTSGVPLVATGGEVRIYFAGSNAAFSSVINLASPGTQGPFFPSHSTPVGSVISLGTFDPGTVLIFRLDVLSTGFQFFTGPAGTNPDNLVHAGYTQFIADGTIPANGLLVGFEDQFGGGDFDYNDHQFVFTNVAPASSVPEPAGITLLLTGLTGVGAAVRRRRKSHLKA
jgi:hypothetical protein